MFAPQHPKLLENDMHDMLCVWEVVRSLKPLKGMLTGYENSYESPVNHCCLYATAIYYILLIIHGEKLSVSRLTFFPKKYSQLPAITYFCTTHVQKFPKKFAVVKQSMKNVRVFNHK